MTIISTFSWTSTEIIFCLTAITNGILWIHFRHDRGLGLGDREGWVEVGGVSQGVISTPNFRSYSLQVFTKSTCLQTNSNFSSRKTLEAVRPDLVEFRHFGQILNVFGHFWGFIGLWWWSSGKSACRLLRRSEFETCWRQQFFCKILFEKNENKPKRCRGWTI